MHMQHGSARSDVDQTGGNKALGHQMTLADLAKKAATLASHHLAAADTACHANHISHSQDTQRAAQMQSNDLDDLSAHLAMPVAGDGLGLPFLQLSRGNLQVQLVR